MKPFLSLTPAAREEFASSGAAPRVEKFLSRITESEREVGAFVDVYSDWAREQSAALDRKRAGGKPLGKLAGLVVAVKNSVAIRGKRLTCSSKMLERYVAPYSATAVERILFEDGIIIGSTNLDEFCCGSDCSRSALVQTHNPHDVTRVPGGSSGGSAAAVSAGFCDLTLSEDTGGSIRCPASFCGASGIHPTYGRVSRYGVADMAMSFDQLGPISSDVLGSALLLSAISGEDSADPTTNGMGREDFSKDLDSLPSKLRVGVPKQFFAGCEPGVSSLVWQRIKELETRFDGVEVSEFDFPLLSYALPVYYLLVFSEFSSAMQKYDGLKYGLAWSESDGRDLVEVVSSVRARGLGPEVKRRILLGTYITSKEYREAWYSKALRARDALVKEFTRVFSSYDVLLGPTMPMVAWRMGEKSQDPLQMYLADVLTVPANCGGLPAGSVPAGMHGTEKMPVGLQVIGATGADALVLQVMRAFERLAPATQTV